MASHRGVPGFHLQDSEICIKEQTLHKRLSAIYNRLFSFFIICKLDLTALDSRRGVPGFYLQNSEI